MPSDDTSPEYICLIQSIGKGLRGRLDFIFSILGLILELVLCVSIIGFEFGGNVELVSV